MLQLLVATAGLGGYMALCKVSEMTEVAVAALVLGLAVAPIVAATLWLVFAIGRSRRTIIAASGALIVAVVLVWQYTDFRIARGTPQLLHVILGWYGALFASLL